MHALLSEILTEKKRVYFVSSNFLRLQLLSLSGQLVIIAKSKNDACKYTLNTHFKFYFL